MYLGRLRPFCHYLLKRKILVENPALDLEMCSLKKNDMSDQRLNFEECLALLKAAYLYEEKYRNRNFALVLMLLTSALRPSELSNLTEDKVFSDFDMLFGKGKTGWRRRFLTEGMNETIHALCEDPERLNVLENMDKKLVFYSDKGGQLKPREMNVLLRKFANMAGINKKITSYWLRRNFATILANSNFSIVEIQKIFDHDRVSSTEQYVLEKLVSENEG